MTEALVRGDCRRPASSAGMPLELVEVDKSFGPRAVLQKLDMSAAAGEFISIVGRSGCGKSTLLRLLAGLDEPGNGWISIDNQVVCGPHPAMRIMFQEARLVPWKTVLENVVLGLRREDARAQEPLSAVGLRDRAADWPTALSGGQRQRVALARALIHRPRLLLLDEPLSALDALTRIEMQRMIERIWLGLGFTAVLVTHDVAEAITLSDRILVMQDGRLASNFVVKDRRPRSRDSINFGRLETQILSQLLG